MDKTLQHRLTLVRSEFKYLLEPPEAQRIFDQIKKRIPPKVVGGRSTSFRVTIYVDTADYDFSRYELQSPDRSVKLRVKDYYVYDGHLPVIGDKYWLEAKVRMGVMVEKSRFSVKKSLVEKVLRDGMSDPLSPEQQVGVRDFESLRKGRRLFPLFIAHYQRTTLQGERGSIRVTLDESVSYHNPLDEIFTLYRGVSRRDLPPPFRTESKSVIEVKVSGSVPAFLEEILDPALRTEYSKFHTGVRELERRGRI